MFSRKLINPLKKIDIKLLSTDVNLSNGLINMSKMKKIKESDRMKKFREKLKIFSQNVNQFQDPLLIEINPKTGEFQPDSEPEPTKWGDWQHGGRVSDF
ncbi:succinate dehydrogenase assembly factor 4, mitochondrial-like [Chelonus insularis]|uniref:succinate dehydrogenase assembly factor 4, mitochondrial-like n=1 Tax=Chelonus insularis TaxID=460826 RepID=UPI0015886EB7|nr:succinate dehydrogenase assembly factor 4, mitochondrial-like [Chelonus insularis]